MKNKKWLILIFTIVILLVLLFSFKFDKEVFSLKEEELFLVVGEEYNLKENIVSSDEVKYFNNSKDKIYIDDNGILIAHNIGDAKVVYKDSDGNTKELIVHIKTNLESINIIEDSIKLAQGKEVVLRYNFFPINAPLNDLKWSSSNESVAIVENGKVIALSKGKTTITLKGSNGIYDSCEVEVYVEPKKIDLNQYNIKMYVDDKVSLKVTITPNDANDKSVKWSSSNPSIASVDANGNVKAKKEGKVVISATTYNGLKAICKIDVRNVPAAEVTINKSNLNLYISEKSMLNATIKPSNTFDKRIIWTSSDPSIVTIDSKGNIMARKTGKAVITAQTSNKKTSTCNVTVTSMTNGKSAIFVGDSITYGFASTPVGYSWANYIKDNYDLGNTVNAGKSGWLISENYDRWIVDEMKRHTSLDYDYVILEGGTNDISHAIDLGTYDINDFSGNYDTTTFLGGLETYIYLAKKSWPNAKIGYIIIYETPNSNNNRIKLSSKYYTEMKKVLDKWGISYLDLYFGKNIDGIKYSDLLKVKTTEYLVDNLHLNNDGYNIISPYIYIWMNSL